MIVMAFPSFPLILNSTKIFRITYFLYTNYTQWMRYDTTSNRTFLFIQVSSISISLTYLCTLIYAMAFVEKKNIFIRKKKHWGKYEGKKYERIAVTKEFWNLNGIWIWNGCWCGGISNRGEKRKFNGICGLKLIGFTYRLSMDSYLSFYFMYCIIM